MSMELYRLARGVRLPPAEKAVLIALCDFMNDKTGLCSPSYETLSITTGYERTTVCRKLKELRKRGFISWKTVRRNGQFGFNCYEIHRDALRHAAQSQEANSNGAELHSLHSPSGTVQPKPLVSTLNEPLNGVNKGVQNNELSANNISDGSKASTSSPPKTQDEFWAMSPKDREFIIKHSPKLLNELFPNGFNNYFQNEE